MGPRAEVPVGTVAPVLLPRSRDGRVAALFWKYWDLFIKFMVREILDTPVLKWHREGRMALDVERLHEEGCGVA